MKFENEWDHQGNWRRHQAYEWVNERGYHVPARMVRVWTHADAVHDWVLVSGDWHERWEEVECIPYVPMTHVEAWACIKKGTFVKLGEESLGEINLFMLKMEKEWLEYELESRLPNEKGEEANE